MRTAEIPMHLLYETRGPTIYSTGLNPFWSTLARELELCINLAGNFHAPDRSCPRVAAILSVVGCCRRLKIPIRDHLADILPGLANAPVQRIADIIPEQGVLARRG